MQLTHSDHKARLQTFPLSIIANNISSPLNVGSLFRISDALGIEKLYLCGDTTVPPNSKLNKTSRSTEKHVTYEYHADAVALLQQLKTDSYIVSLEITSDSLPLHSSQVKAQLVKQNKICMIIGEENHGISVPLLALSDITIHIPMHGQNSSMNVVTATSIASYEIIQLLK